MRFLKQLTVLFVLLGASAYGQVLINEVLFYADPASTDAFRTHQWVELVNLGADAVDLTGWSVSAADGVNGASKRELPAVQLPAGGYLVVHFSAGQNQLDFSKGGGDYYTSDVDGTAYFKTAADEAALYSPSGIVDFINWAHSTAKYEPGAAHNAAVAAKIWTAGSVLLYDRIGAELLEQLRYVAPGDSIGRDLASTDTNTIRDFDALGGPSGLGPTPGAQNLTPSPVLSASDDKASPLAAGRAAGANAKWTVLLYMSSDNNLEAWFLRKLLRVQQSGGSTAGVNIVAMWDAKTINTTTYRGLIGPSRMDRQLALLNPAGENADIGERDMGDPQELAGFISWGKKNYPADKYALVISSHGQGWKGISPDETFPSGTRVKNDTLYMGELSSALAGNQFEWIALDACLMAAIEVAHQLQPFAKYLISSQEVSTAGDFPYESLASSLAMSPDWDALDSVKDIFANYVPLASTYQAQTYTVSVMDLRRVPDLSVNIRAWADLLAPGMSLFQTRDTPADNVQVLTKNQLNAVEVFHDENFIDLYHFGKLMQGSGVPGCLLTPVQSILDIIKTRVVIMESHGPGHPNANGVHIYFPKIRMASNVAFLKAPYDYPFTRTFDGSSPFAHYGILQDSLPLKALDPETQKDFDFNVWPFPQAPDFKFPNDTGWRKVLDRYYHPAADNRILRGMTPAGVTVLPTTISGGACGNASDTITVPVGSTVFFSGAGSSDADQGSGILPSHHFWDEDASLPCVGSCIPPHQVGPGSNAATASSDNKDADVDIANTTADDQNGAGPAFSRGCIVPGTYIVTLNVWDDNHTFPFHNTLPNASYVHPQTSRHAATMICTGCPTFGFFELTFTPTDDPVGSAPFVGLTAGRLTMTRSGTNGAQVSVTGDRPQLVPAQGDFNSNACGFDLTGTSTGIVGGFRNVVGHYNLTVPGPNFNTVTGTYKLGERGTLNGANDVITYRVTGTVTNAR